MEDPRFLNNRNFVGIEAEGKAKGTRTLFIGKNDISTKELAMLFKMAFHKEVFRVYFGAGSTHCMPHRANVLDALQECTLEHRLKCRFAAELAPIPSVLSHPFLAHPSIEIILNMTSHLVKDRNDLVLNYPASEIKFEIGDDMFVFPAESMIYTSKNDKLFKLDAHL